MGRRRHLRRLRGLFRRRLADRSPGGARVGRTRRASRKAAPRSRSCSERCSTGSPSRW
jgi:hypothetical protein